MKVSRILKNLQAFVFLQQRSLPWEGGTRNVGFIYSPLLKNSQFIFKDYFHTSDILPTFAGAAGIDVEGLDGFNFWPVFMNGGEAPRKEVVTVLDNVNKITALIKGPWKLVNGTGLGGTLDKYLGDIQKFKLSDDAYAAKVLNSKVQKAIKTLQPRSQRLTSSKINALRRSATINCNDDQNENIPCNPLEAACLYNIQMDPCERMNLAGVYHKKLAELVARMNYLLANDVVPSRRTGVDDPNCDPKLHDGNWVPWILQQ